MLRVSQQAGARPVEISVHLTELLVLARMGEVEVAEESKVAAAAASVENAVEECMVEDIAT